MTTASITLPRPTTTAAEPYTVRRAGRDHVKVRIGLGAEVKLSREELAEAYYAASSNLRNERRPTWQVKVEAYRAAIELLGEDGA